MKLRIEPQLRAYYAKCEEKVNRYIYRIIIILLFTLSICSAYSEVYLGIYLTEYINENQKSNFPDYGLIVHNVIVDSPAAEANIRANDILLKVEDIKLTSVDQLVEVLKNYKAGDDIKVEYFRADKNYETKITLGNKELPNDNHPYLGVLTSKQLPSMSAKFNYGLRVDYLYPDSPLHKYKLKVDDLILSLNNEKLYTPNQLEVMLNNYTKEDVVEFIVANNADEIRNIKVQLKPIPNNGLWQEFDLSNLEERIEELIDQSKTFIFKIESQEDHVIGIEISPQKTNQDNKGVVITHVVAKSPAHKANLKSGDIIIKIDDKEIHKASEVIAAFQKTKAGNFVTIEILRDGNTFQTKVQVVKRKSIFE